MLMYDHFTPVCARGMSAAEERELAKKMDELAADAFESRDKELRQWLSDSDIPEDFAAVICAAIRGQSNEELDRLREKFIRERRESFRDRAIERMCESDADS